MITARRRGRGQALVEFALVFPILFFILALTLDLFRVDWATTTVAEAARQGARQAVANEDTSDNPFAASSGSCSGTTLTPSANGNGCLTNARVLETVRAVLGGFSTGAAITENTPANCPNPLVGQASVCIYPSETGAAGAYATCAAAKTALGRDPIPGDLGSRSAEYTTPQYKGCFEVVVTVIYQYSTLVPFLGSAAPNLLKLKSSTTMLAEY
ncbi:MAG TPA: TadE/TadG family type IV pilus assembly protein [Candidatus Dormibacteraeota bacterium]|nr:TadE/TadG family type IV pilus assembly protein [Candidatus Dormibacteraeota bacterium]